MLRLPMPAVFLAPRRFSTPPHVPQSRPFSGPPIPYSRLQGKKANGENTNPYRMFLLGLWGFKILMTSHFHFYRKSAVRSTTVLSSCDGLSGVAPHSYVEIVTPGISECRHNL